MKDFNRISYLLAFFATLMSAKYLCNSFNNISLGGESFFENIVLVFSNLLMTFVFLFVAKSYLIYGSNKLIEIKRAKSFSFTILLYVVFSLCVLINFTLEYGFFSGEILFNQITSIILSLLITIFLIQRLTFFNSSLKIKNNLS